MTLPEATTHRSLPHGFTLACALVLGLSISAASSEEQATDEYHVKAAFLYNFARFVEWPPKTLYGPDNQFAICILGEDPFGRALEDIIGGQTLEGRRFRIMRITSAAQAGVCQIVFISSADRKSVSATAALLPQSGVLTVAETDAFATSGVIINFILRDGRVRFQINRRVADRAGLQISSRLLSLAQVIDH